MITCDYFLNIYCPNNSQINLIAYQQDVDRDGHFITNYDVEPLSLNLETTPANAEAIEWLLELAAADRVVEDLDSWHDSDEIINAPEQIQDWIDQLPAYKPKSTKLGWPKRDPKLDQRKYRHERVTISFEENPDLEYSVLVAIGEVPDELKEDPQYDDKIFFYFADDAEFDSAKTGGDFEFKIIEGDN